MGIRPSLLFSCLGQEGKKKKKWWNTPQKMGGTPSEPPTHPKTPLAVTLRGQKGINLLLFQFPIHLRTHHTEKLSCSRVMGQKLSSGRPCIPALPGTHNLLASPLTALLTSPFIVTSYIIAILEVWTDLLHVHLYTPCRPHPCAHGTDSQPCTDPPFTQLTQRGCH